jgi:hypothetical protein
VTLFGFEIRRPQVYGGLLLVALAGAALAASRRAPLSADEIQALDRSFYVNAPIKPELRQEKDPVADSILLYRVTPLFEPSFDQLEPGHRFSAVLVRWLPALYRLPFLVFGLWLGGALWWVSRRLFNNEGGYVALGLFCFSPLVIAACSRINAEIIAAWGLFGIVYTAIGVGHTLYSPPGRWPPRIVLLGLAFGFTAAAHLGAALLGAALAIFFMLYLCPRDRKPAALAVLGLAVVIACLFVWGCYGWNSSVSSLFAHAGETLRPVSLRNIVASSGLAFDGRFSWTSARELPTLVLLLVSLGVFLGWRRTRYFGNWTPLVVMALVVALPFPDASPLVWAAPFAYVFAGGIAADLLDSRYRRVTQAALVLLMGAQAVLSFSIH